MYELAKDGIELPKEKSVTCRLGHIDEGCLRWEKWPDGGSSRGQTVGEVYQAEEYHYQAAHLRNLDGDFLPHIKSGEDIAIMPHSGEQAPLSGVIKPREIGEACPPA
jgi:hypothetical protein